ncbi:hypothetical protein TNCV_4995431 [Trichonephila clavipes]|nr:hypothetical protein TNCV_4995431 [Trichonephila clavipes]
MIQSSSVNADSKATILALLLPIPTTTTAVAFNSALFREAMAISAKFDSTTATTTPGNNGRHTTYTLV